MPHQAAVLHRVANRVAAGKSVAAVAARCLDLAEAEIKRPDSGVFAVENLSAK